MQQFRFQSGAIAPTRRMDKIKGLAAAMLLLVGGLAVPPIALADMVLTAPDGRKVQLKDDGSWRYQESAGKGKVEPKDQAPGPMADLVLERKIGRNTGCRLEFSLTNNLPYEIRHVIPYFSVYRPNGVLHETLSAAFQSVRPSDKIERTVDFSRITCEEIARVQVTGGDRCEMGELHKFSEANGQCLARIRVTPSDLLRFDK
jgi:hypothetical protein